MPITATNNWLQQSWLSEQWLSGESSDAQYSQVNFKIVDQTKILRSQFDKEVINNKNLNSQVQYKINSTKPNRSQVNLRILDEKQIGSQVQKSIHDFTKSINSQFEINIESLHAIRSQLEKKIVAELKELGCQVEGHIDELNIYNSEVFKTNLYYVICQGFLENSWLTENWLVPKRCAGSRNQVDLKVASRHSIGSQIEFFIEDIESSFKTQAIMTIDVEMPLHSQVKRLFTERLKCQVLVTLYNITKPRILCEFPSRGTTGLNWTANTTESGDFSVLNVNNDISEMYWRSQNGVTSNIVLTCDTEIPQGIFMDTFYMEGHNMTSSAIVVLEASNDSNFSPVQLTRNLAPKNDKIFFVEPTLPYQSYRYWRIRISDPTNINSFIKVGTIIFGASTILNANCTTREIILTSKEFKNAVRTEGFTSVGNSRSLKRAIKVDFRNITYDSGDYTKLNDVITFARTTLKCLWLPDARSQSLMHRFGVFGKLTGIPEQRHNVMGINENNDYIDISLEIDEAE